MAGASPVPMLFLLVGYMVMGSMMMWFIVSGVTGETVNYVNIPPQGYTNITTSIDFTTSVPKDLYAVSTNALFIDSWVTSGAGMVSKPVPFFPAILCIKGIVTQDGYYKNIYYINNTNRDRFGIIIDATLPASSNAFWLVFGDGIITVQPPTGTGQDFSSLDSLRYNGEDYTQYPSIIVETWYNPVTYNLKLFIDREDPDTGALTPEQIFSWTVQAIDPSATVPPIFHGGVVAYEENTVLTKVLTKSVISYNPKADIVSQSMNFFTFMFQLVTFTVPTNIFPPPFVSVLIPALFFYVPLLGIVACVVNILWPVI